MTKDKLLKDYTMIQNTIIRTEKLDVYQKSCINNILSNEEDFKMSLNALAKRIPSSRDKCIKVINTLKELNVVSVSKIKTPNGDWDSNVYKVNSEELFKYLGVVVDKDNVVFNKDYLVVDKDYLVVDKDNGSISERLGVVVENDTKNTNKNTNIENIYSSNDYEEIWKAYPNKKGKAKSITYINKILKFISKEELFKCIDRYKQDVENQRTNGFKTLAYKNGSTFFNGGYIDYLDKNYQEENENIEKFNRGQVIEIDEILGERV